MNFSSKSISQDCTIEIIQSPSNLSQERIHRLTEEFSSLAWLGTGGPEWQSYSPACKGWSNYFRTPGHRPCDYGRLVLSYHQGTLTHFTGVSHRNLDQDSLLIWFVVTITHPEYRKSGLLLSSIDTLLDQWLKTLKRKKVYVALKTPNPIVYEAMRSLAQIYRARGVSIQWYPSISSEGKMEPIPHSVQEQATTICKLITDNRPFNSNNFVIDGHFKHMGPVFFDLNFPCHNQGTKKYFDTHLRKGQEDGLLVLVVADLP